MQFVAMPTREETEYSRRGTDREGENSTPSLREPIEHLDMLEVPMEAPAANEEPKESIDDVVSRLIMHEDKPIENLPTMSAPELKIIGRCVNLSTKQTINGITSVYHYTGLVSAVTAAAVTLMCVNRYTDADFKVFIERERAIGKAARASAREMTERRGGRPGPQHVRSPSSEMDQDQGHVETQARGYSTEGAVGAGHDGELTGQSDGAALLAEHASGSLVPAVPMTFESEGDEKAFSLARDGEVEESSNANGSYGGANGVLRPPHFRTCLGSVGPLPFVSFLRKSIHDVKFARDPRSSFYNLLHDPSKRLMDMQYLRMFVRRYIVHTSEGNNPRQVPMYAFVTVRGACPDLDRELANQLVREELPGLMKADRAIEKEKKRNRNREVRRDLAIQEYRAPPGLFSNTGILYLTHTPQSTFLSAVLIAFFTIVFVVFLAVTVAVFADAFVSDYLSHLMSYFIACLVVWLLAGLCIGLHSISMHVPLQDDRLLIIGRALLTLGAIGCVIMALVKLLGTLSNNSLYSFMELRSSSLLCDFYDRYQCSGLTASCRNTHYFDPGLCNGCPSAIDYSNICYHALWGQLQIIVIPLLVFCVFILLASIHSVFQFVKLWLMARALSARV